MIIICGPCVIEDRDTVLKTAEVISKVIPSNLELYFKGSCFKDNRTRLENFSGVDFEKGIKILTEVNEMFNIPVTTDFHNREQLEKYGHLVDLIQIPAYLAMQTLLIDTAAKLNKPIHIKKPQFLSPFKIYQPVNKIRNSGIGQKKIMVSDRGTCFGYDNVMVDPRHIRLMKKSSIYVLADITHPNKGWNDYKNAFILGMSAIAAGADGLFFETHINPESALCDADTQIPVSEVEKFIKKIIDLKGVIDAKD